MYTNLEAMPVVPPSPPRRLPSYFWIGVAVLALSPVMLLFEYDFGFQPLMWAGYIIMIDAIIWQRGGYSLVKDHPRELLMMLFISNLSWLIYEAYNFQIISWAYIREPLGPFYHLIRFAAGFAIITPAILQTAELLNVFGVLSHVRTPQFHLTPFTMSLSFIIGLALATIPLSVSNQVANIMTPLVWLSFPPLLEPLLVRMRVPSLLRQLSFGYASRTFQVLIAGFICGLIFEVSNGLDLWRHLSGWLYNVAPIYHIYIGGRDILIGQMPIIGFGGYPPFALAVFELYVLLKSAFHVDYLDNQLAWVESAPATEATAQPAE